METTSFRRNPGSKGDPGTIHRFKLTIELDPTSGTSTEFPSTSTFSPDKPTLWRRNRKIGQGAFGTVWQESSLRGTSEVHRAVKEVTKKEITKTLRPTPRIEYTRELHALGELAHVGFSNLTHLLSALPCLA